MNREVWDSITNLESEIKKLKAEKHALQIEVKKLAEELSAVRLENKEILWRLDNPHPQIEGDFPY